MTERPATCAVCRETMPIERIFEHLRDAHTGPDEWGVVWLLEGHHVEPDDFGDAA